MKHDSKFFIENERIECNKDIDFEAMKIYADNCENLKMTLYPADNSSFTFDEMNENILHTFRALTEQNFMLLRKIDTLNAKVDALYRIIELSK